MSLSVSITIGSYKMPSMVKANVACCRSVFGPETPILISDDKSHLSDEIKAWADDNGVAYLGNSARMSHFSGDMQALVRAVVFAESCETSVALKISQRFIPIADGFRLALEAAMDNPEVMMCLPGQVLPQQVARPQSGFFARFGSLSDCVAIRTGAITGQKIRDIYAECFNGAKSRNEGLVEVVVAKIANNCFPGNACQRLAAWTNHVPFQKKLYLRRCQSTQEEYIRIGVDPQDADLREWLQIERENYLCRPSCV